MNPLRWCCPLIAAGALGAAERPAWRADAVGMMDEYSQGRSREAQLDLSLGRRLANGWTPVLAYSHEHRFGTDDDRYEGWLYTPGFGPAYGWMAVAGTPDNDFLADWEAQIGGEAEWSTGTSVSSRLHHRSYPDERTWTATVQVRQQVLPWLAVDLGGVGAWSDQEPTVGSGLAGIEVRPGEPWSIRLGGSVGEENTPPQPVSEVRTLTGTIRCRLSDRLSWRMDVTHEHREDLYDRTGVSMGGTIRF